VSFHVTDVGTESDVVLDLKGVTTRRNAASPGDWFRLGLGVIAILLFMFGLDPLLSRIRPVEELTAFIEARDIDAGAYWWSDSEEYAPAWLLLHDSLKYSGTNRQREY